MAVDHGLLERSVELDAADRVLARARAGCGSVLLVEGVAGIGKTSLLEVTAGRARRQGCTVLTSRASSLERDLPFGVVLQMLEPHLASLPARERARLLDALTPPARLLLEAGGAADATPPSDGGREAFVVLRGLQRLVAGIADGGPVALIVDDLQWCDEPSFRFLRHLTGRVGELRLAVFLATRPGADHVDEFVASVGTTERLTVVRPRPLSEAAVAALARDAFGAEPAPAFVAECLGATGGSPFLLRELLTTLVPEVDQPDEAAAGVVRHVAPEILQLRVRRRLYHQPEASRRILHAVAVLGADAQLRNVVALAGVDADGAARAVDRLAAEDILTAGHTLAFSHPVLQAGAVGQLTPLQQAALHMRAFDLLAAEGVAPDRLAIHAVAATPSGRADVVELLRGVARRARARGASDAAVSYLRRALAEPPEPAVRADLLVELASAESAVGDPGAVERFHAALGLIDDPVRRAEVWERIGQVLLDAGDHDGAADAFERGHHEAADRDGEVALRLEAGYVLAARTNLATRADAHRRLEAILDRGLPGSGPAERRLLAEAAYQATLLGQRARAVDFATRALSAGGGDLHERHVREAFYSSTLVLLMTDEVAAAADAIEAGLRAARRSGSARMFAAASHLRAALEFRLGQLGDCIVDAQAALDGARHGWNIVLPSTHSYLALALLEQGDPAAAREALELPGGDEPWTASSPFIYYLYGRGRVLAEAGDLDGAVEVFLELGRRQEMMGAEASAGIPWRSWAASCLDRRGERAAALQLAAEEVRVARAFGVPYQIGIALAAWGEIEGGPDGLARIREAVALLERAGAPLEEARARLRLGRLARHAPTDVRPSADVTLSTALDLASACGAGLLAAAVERELAAAGAPSAAPSTVPRDPLTPLERRVAALVAEGRTDRDIADALFLPARSVGEHVAAIRRKLRVSSVEELRARLRDEQESRPAAISGVRTLPAPPAGRDDPEVGADAEPLPAPAVELRFFGPTEVRVGGRVQPLARGVPTKLVQIVAAGGGNVHADEMVEELWPDEEPGRGRARLRHVLYRVRQTVGPVVVRDGERVRFADDVDADVVAFDREAARSLALAADDPSEAARVAARAVARYRGELLMEVPYETWAVAPRERARRRYVALLDLLADDARRRERPAEAIALLERAVEADPSSEDRYVRAAAMAADLGRRATAMTLLRRARELTARLGVAPSDALVRLEDDLTAANTTN